MGHGALDPDSRLGLLVLLALAVVPVALVFGTLPAVCYSAFVAALVYGGGPMEPSGRAGSVDLAGCTDCPCCGSHQVDIVRHDADEDYEVRWACFACDRTWSIH